MVTVTKKMEFQKIDNTKYYRTDIIINNYKNFNKGCKTNAQIIEKREIPEDAYIYARLKNKNKWVKSDGSSKKFDKIFISKEWFDDNYANDKENLDKIKDETKVAPPIIKLTKNEKFVDANGDFIEIEVRGEREVDQCYFKVSDVSKGFDMPRLHDVITDPTKKYNAKEDYIYFCCENTTKSRKNKTKKLFLTYNGILKVLYSSRNNKTKPFTSWATKTLFTAHLGTPQSKTKLASSLLGIDLASVKKFLSASPSALSVIYFIFIGYVKDVREKFNLDEDLDDNLMMCRYGYTDDLNIRIGQHKTKFGNQIELLLFNIIDSSFLSKAENSLDKYFESMDSLLDVKIKGNNETEVVVIEKTDIKNIKDQFELIGSKYEGKMSKQAEFVKDLITKHEKEIMTEKHEKEIMTEKHKNDLLKKDNEILKQQLEIAQLKAKIKK